MRQAGYTPMVSDGRRLYLISYYSLIGLQPTRALRAQARDPAGSSAAPEISLPATLESREDAKENLLGTGDNGLCGRGARRGSTDSGG
jgi:hypothetical protein